MCVMERNFVQKATVIAEGTVRSFDEAIGKGLIARDEGMDVYVNRAAIKDLGPRTLVTGDRVRFQVVEGVKGPCAASVRKLQAADSTGH
jgi:CspA family cold shock protein